jgi:hypothetical protein
MRKLALLILIGPAIDMRDYLPNASPDLYDLLTFEDPEGGYWIPAVMGLGLGALGGVFALLPRHARALLALTVGGLLVMGLFSGVVRSPLLASPLASIGRELFASNGLTLTGAVVVVVAVVLVYLLHVWLKPGERARKLPAEQKKQLAIPMSIVLLRSTSHSSHQSGLLHGGLIHLSASKSRSLESTTQSELMSPCRA